MAYLVPDNLKSRKDVPHAIRQVATAFNMGFDEGATLWYEPPYDPSGAKPHLVLLIPNVGIVVLEVLDVKAESVLGVFRGKIRVLRDEREIETDDPLVRASKHADVLRRRISAEPRLVGVDIPVGAGAVLPSVSSDLFRSKRFDRLLAEDRCILQEHLPAARDQNEGPLFKACTRMLKPSSDDPMPDSAEKIVHGIIQPEAVIDRAAAAKTSQLVIFRKPTGSDDIVRVMDRNQEAIAKSLGQGHRVVRGVAGSGKTLILVYRARLLASMLPTKRILLTCFTKSLAGQLRTMLGEHENVEVIHLDSLMSKAIKAARLDHPGYDSGDNEAVAEVAVRALPSAGLSYRAVLLDEAQDFGTQALRFVVGLLEPGSDDLVIVADAAQNIFRRNFSWKDAGIQAQGRTRILRINYRNTTQILDFASRFLLGGQSLDELTENDTPDENLLIPPKAALRGGPPVRLEVTGSYDGEIGAVVNLVRSLFSDKGPRQFAVLHGSYKQGLQLERALKNADLDVFWLTRNPKSKLQLPETDCPIILSTVESAKGLEFPTVVACGLWREDRDADTNRRTAYVAMTRATQELAVVTSTSNPLTEDLRRALA